MRHIARISKACATTCMTIYDHESCTKVASLLSARSAPYCERSWFSMLQRLELMSRTPKRMSSTYLTLVSLVVLFLASTLIDINLDGRQKKDKGLGAPPVAALLAAVLQDAQTRLFFRAQAAIQSEIRGFVPKDSDLAYPAILLGEGSHIVWYTGVHLADRLSYRQGSPGQLGASA